MEKAEEYIRRIVVAVNCIDGLYDLGAKWKGVKTNTLILLYALGDEQAHTQKNICEEWLIPRTTLNTIIKECQADGYITLSPIAGYKRDLHISLTESGKIFAKAILAPIYQAEQNAMVKTLEKCSPTFIDDLELFCANLKSSFKNMNN